MWPFAKLRNGFGSHRYVYSPILLDSQELITFYLPHQLQPAGSAASPVTTIVPRVVDHGDGQWRYQLCILAGSAAGTCELNYRLGLTFDGNGQWRRISRTCSQGRWSCTISTTQWFGGRLAMEPMEGATIPEKIYSKL